MSYSPTVRGRRLIREVTRLRHEAGLSMETAAARLGWSTSKMYRLENGRTRITIDDLADMLDTYGTTGSEQDRLIRLCRDARAHGWWTAYADVFSGSYIALEAEAAAIRTHAHIVVPGIFQTPDYARAVITATRSDTQAHDPERIVAARAARQRSLFARAEPPRVHAILDEAVLHRRVGEPGMMAAQLRELGEAATRPDVTIQVLLFSSGTHAGMDGKFTLLEFAEDPPVVYVEGLMGDVYLEADEAARFTNAWDRLIGQALPPAESRQLIAAIAKENM